jgi:hypothetical protein
VAIDGTDLYYETSHVLAKMPLGGGTTTVLSQSSSYGHFVGGLAFDTENVYFAASNGTQNAAILKKPK